MGRTALSESDEKPEVGKVFADKYLIVKELGEGGFSIVYGAHNGRTTEGFPVAIKWMKPEKLKDEATLMNAVHEADLAGHIQSKHVVQVFDKSFHPPFIVMEWLRGKTLRSALNDHLAQFGRPMTPAEVGPLLLPAMKGVIAAHKRHWSTGKSLVHRDLKPENIFLAESDDDELRPVVLDFGIAKLVQPDQDINVTTSEFIRGTIDYMSREQLYEREHVGPWTDVYALGVILYELLAGVRPYRATQGEDTLHVTLKIHEGAHEPLDHVVPNLPAKLVAIVEKAIATDFRQRYQSVAELSRELEPWLAPKASGGRVALPEPTPPPASTSKPQVMRRNLLAAGSAALAVALAAIGLWAYSSMRPARSPNALRIQPARESAGEASRQHDHIKTAQVPAAPALPEAVRDDQPLDVEPVQTGLSLNTQPPAASVSIDDAPTQRAPVHLINLDPGRHKVRISKPNYRAHVQWVDIEKGEVLELGTVTLAQVAAPAPRRGAGEPASQRTEQPSGPVTRPDDQRAAAAAAVAAAHEEQRKRVVGYIQAANRDIRQQLWAHAVENYCRALNLDPNNQEAEQGLWDIPLPANERNCAQVLRGVAPRP